MKQIWPILLSGQILLPVSSSDLRRVASIFFPELLSFSRLRTETRWSLLAVLVDHLHKFIVFDDEDDRVKKRVR